MLVKDLEHMCPYWEICATVQFHHNTKVAFILNVCCTHEHLMCIHYAGVSVLSDKEINRIKKDFKDKYGESKTLWGSYKR